MGFSFVDFGTTKRKVKTDRQSDARFRRKYVLEIPNE